jgi:hypothetical protein
MLLALDRCDVLSDDPLRLYLRDDALELEPED